MLLQKRILSPVTNNYLYLLLRCPSMNNSKTTTVEDLVKTFSLHNDLFIHTVMIRGPHAYHPVTLQAEVAKDNYHEAPYVRNFEAQMPGMKSFLDLFSSDEQPAPKRQRPKHLFSSLSFMNETYEQLPWFATIRYDGEQLTERLLHVSLTPATFGIRKLATMYPEQTLFPQLFSAQNYWEESENEIFWKFTHANRTEFTGEDSKYSLILKATAAESDILSQLTEQQYNLLMNLQLGDKVPVHRDTINDYYD